MISGPVTPKYHDLAKLRLSGGMIVIPWSPEEALWLKLFTTICYKKVIGAFVAAVMTTYNTTLQPLTSRLRLFDRHLVNADASFSHPR